MKSLSKITMMSVLALVAVAVGTSTAQAQEVSATVDTSVTVETTSPSPVGVPPRKTPPPQKTSPAIIRAEVQMRTETKKEERQDKLMFKRNETVRKEIAKKMESRAFEARKMALVKELKRSLLNISNISTRLEARIEKAEGEGRNMVEAKQLLSIAKTKLAKAQVDVAAFEALPIPGVGTTTTSTTVTASTTPSQVDLTKPRLIGDTAIKSVKEAKEAFQKVVVAIAHAMGLKGEGRIEASVSPTPTPTTTQ